MQLIYIHIITFPPFKEQRIFPFNNILIYLQVHGHLIQVMKYQELLQLFKL